MGLLCRTKFGLDRFRVCTWTFDNYKTGQICGFYLRWNLAWYSTDTTTE